MMKKRNKFPLSHSRLLTCDMGELVPLGTPLEVIPGDSVQHATSALIRMSPLLAPVMHPLHVRIHHWFVPHRLVWQDWEEFITGFDRDSVASAKTFPTITFAGAVNEGELADYLGVPTGVAGLEVSALPFRGYNLIHREHYRDQQLQTSPTIDLTDGADTTTDTDLLNVCWEKDYFTTTRPEPQLGADITIGLGDSAPVVKVPYTEDNSPMLWRKSADDTLFAGAAGVNTDGSGQVSISSQTGYLDPNGRLEADLSSATPLSMADFREAMGLQRYAEARNRWGSRYSEYLRYLGVPSPDGRIDRPEYLGGGKNTIQFSEVLQTAGTTDGSAVGVGDLKGHGIGGLRTNRYRRFFPEHGYVFSFLSVLPRTVYMQGIPRTFNRRTKEDFFVRELQNIGEQEVLNKEIYAGAALPDGVFGYRPRYDDYRKMFSGVHGEFRGSTLHHWHMARKFASEPALNAAFVASNPTNRIYASTATDGLFVMAQHSIQARRLINRGPGQSMF